MIKAVNEAREWIGTPYRHQHSTKGAGCDCLGLVRGVYRAVIGPETETVPNYSPSWGEVGRKDLLLLAAARNLIKRGHWDVDNLAIGDVVVFRMSRNMVAKHCGIVSSPTQMIHAYQGAGKVCETTLVPYWRSRVAGVFKWPR